MTEAKEGPEGVCRRTLQDLYVYFHVVTRTRASATMMQPRSRAITKMLLQLMKKSNRARTTYV